MVGAFHEELSRKQALPRTISPFFISFFSRSSSPAEKSPNARRHPLALAATAAKTEAGNHLTGNSAANVSLQSRQGAFPDRYLPLLVLRDRRQPRSPPQGPIPTQLVSVPEAAGVPVAPSHHPRPSPGSSTAPTRAPMPQKLLPTCQDPFNVLLPPCLHPSPVHHYPKSLLSEATGQDELAPLSATPAASPQPQNLLVHPSSPPPTRSRPGPAPQLHSTASPTSAPTQEPAPHPHCSHLPLTTAVSTQIPNPLHMQPPHLPCASLPPQR